MITIEDYVGKKITGAGQHKKGKWAFVIREYKRQCKRKPPVEYTRDEYILWLLNEPKFNSLYKAWQDSDFDVKLKPSTDRIKHKIGYTLSNIQLMTWEENRIKGINEVGRTWTPAKKRKMKRIAD